MKTIGLIGGTSWESSREYYRIINELVKEKLGGMHSAKCILYSVDFAELARLREKGGWERVAERFSGIARNLEASGAGMILLCANTTHIVAPEVEESVSIPLIHIVDATVKEIRKKGFKRVGLLGTKYTMEEDFYRKRLVEKHGIETIVPDSDDRELVNSVIVEELCMGKLTDSSRRRYIGIIGRLAEQGAQGVILGCTEIPLLVKEGDVEIPLFDTTAIHAKAAVDFALK